MCFIVRSEEAVDDEFLLYDFVSPWSPATSFCSQLGGALTAINTQVMAVHDLGWLEGAACDLRHDTQAGCDMRPPPHSDTPHSHISRPHDPTPTLSQLATSLCLCVCVWEGGGAVRHRQIHKQHTRSSLLANARAAMALDETCSWP